MNIRLGDNLTKFVIGIGAAILVIASALAAFSNAKTIIPPTFTYALTGLIVVAISLVLLLEKKGLLDITYSSGSTFRFSDLKSIAVISALLIVIWIPRFVGRAPQFNAGVTTQRGILEVPELKTYEVLYHQPFSSVPNLTFSRKINNKYMEVLFEVVEQRKDGFKIRISSLGSGYAIEWIAVGPTK